MDPIVSLWIATVIGVALSPDAAWVACVALLAPVLRRVWPLGLLLGVAIGLSLPEGPVLTGPTLVRGVVAAAPMGRMADLQVSMCDGAPCRGRVRVRFQEPVAFGSSWQVRGRASAPRSPGLLGGPDPAQAARLARVRTMIYAEEAVRIGVVKTTPVKRGNAAVLAAIATGDRRGVDEDTWTLLRDTGTAHLLAISGFHVGVVAGMVGGLFAVLARLAGGLRPQGVSLAWAWWIGALAGVAYAAFAGAPISAQRAAGVGLLAAAGRSMGRRVDPLRLVGAIAVLVCVVDPSAIATPGFQLSFGAVLGLVCFGPLLDGWSARLPLRFLTRGLVATFAATLGTLPAAAWWFQAVAPGSPLANLIAIPWMAVGVVPWAVGAHALPGPLASLCEWVGSVSLAGLFVLLEPLRTAPLTPAVDGLGALLCCAIFLRPKPGWTFAVLLLVLGLRSRPVDALQVRFFDVGQGDAALVDFPTGRRWLVDTGRSPRLLSGLRRRGVRKLDVLVLSHPDVDHAGGAQAIVCGLRVGMVWIGHPAGHEGLLAEAQRCGVPVVVRPSRHVGRNEGSLVVRAESPWGDVLFTGDVGALAEEDLRRPAAVLKIPHHGSRTSSSEAMLDRIRPAVAVLSVGPNRYGHPHDEVLERYAARNIPVLRTATTLRLDRHGVREVETGRRFSPMRYDHAAVEARWQAWWVANDTFATPTDRTRPKYYLLDMFPYPSGTGLHVGHPKGYVATDVVGRAKRMMGFNVLRVMGWDSFGLPAERQAVKEGIHPAEVTKRNIATFRAQLQRLGLGYDWSREFATSDPKHYRWTQWIFRKLYERGLAFQADVPVNWCPALQTVLSNEEVNDGVYIETGDPVEQRTMKQWMLRITAYADRLLAGLDDVDWPHSTEKKQRDWIGRSEGAQFSFEIVDQDTSFEVFTTRPDTLFGCTYVVLAPEHALVESITTDVQQAEVEAYRERTRRISVRDRTTQAADAPKTGAFTGAFARNPVNGEIVPVWISDYVLATYGTGAVYACPAHDIRDHAFATGFGLPIREVVSGGEDVQTEAYTGDGPHVNSDFLDGLEIEAAKTRIIAWLEEKGVGAGTVNFKLRDWLFSRQRYWGEPFPIVFDDEGTAHLLPESALPVELPVLTDTSPTVGPDGEPAPPLARATEWMKAPQGRRETNTMPQWAGSCWYYLRYLSPDRDDVPWDAEEEKYWMPVDLYVGGNEHAVLHLLYARFWHQVLFDEGLVSTPEPFTRLFHQGMIHALAFNRAENMRGKFFYPYEVEQKDDGEWQVKETGEHVFSKNMKMSKSRNNVSNPNDVCEEFGADALRLYEVFMGPLEEGGQWEDAGVAGTKRFLDRVWRLVVDPMTGERPSKLGGTGSKDLLRALHLAIQEVSEGVDSLKFNTAVARMMVFVNEATGADQVPIDALEDFLKILAPFAPHIAEELWARLGHTESIADASWPVFDPAMIVLDTLTLAVQVNGKVRAKIEVASDASKEDVLAAAKADDKIADWLAKGALKREIVVPGRLINFVVAVGK